MKGSSTRLKEFSEKSSAFFIIGSLIGCSNTSGIDGDRFCKLDDMFQSSKYELLCKFAKPNNAGKWSEEIAQNRFERLNRIEQVVARRLGVLRVGCPIGHGPPPDNENCGAAGIGKGGDTLLTDRFDAEAEKFERNFAN